MYKTHTSCRACGFGKPGVSGIKSAKKKEALVPVFNLGVQPLANDFRRDGEEVGGYAPLRVLYCPRCSLAQLSVVVRPDILYRNYTYITSASDTMLQHFDALFRDLPLPSHRQKLLEIGSNDGALLAHFQKAYDVLGVDPAANLCEAAQSRGVYTIKKLWDADAAKAVRLRMTPDVVIARHVFCHCDNWAEFVDALDIVAGADTLICIEVPHGQSLLDNCEFDTIYHEHLSYFTLRACEALLANSPFRMRKVVKYPIHGGAIMVQLVRQHRQPETAPEVREMIEAEDCGLERWRQFDERASQLMLNLRQTIKTMSSQGFTIAGLGASAKSTVWINACQFRREEIAFVADSTPAKWYSTSPGSDIPITDEGAILRELPNYVVMFCWNFRDEVLRRNDLYRQKGGKFIVPVPSVQVI